MVIAIGDPIDTPEGMAVVTAVDVCLPRTTEDAHKGAKVSAITESGEPFLGRWLEDCQPWGAA